MFRFLIFAVATSIVIFCCSANRNKEAMFRAVDFEVFGRVQGVFFRKYTKEQAQSLGLRGWCKNTSRGTVQGHLQGPPDLVQSMVQWLRTTGSPSSIIEKVEFSNQKDIPEYSYNNFSIIKD